MKGSKYLVSLLAGSLSLSLLGGCAFQNSGTLTETTVVMSESVEAVSYTHLGDNPAGQDDECTPFILIRDIGNARPEKYVPKKAINGES